MGKRFDHITGPVMAQFMADARTDAKGKPDGADCRAISDALYGDGKIAALAREMHADDTAFQAAAGGMAGRYGHKRGRAGGIGCGLHDDDSAMAADDPRNQPGMRQLPGCDDGPRCDGDILGYTTLGAGDDALAGPAVAGAVTVSGNFTVDSGNAYRYQPHYFFWEGRDQNNDFEVTPSYLVSAQIGGTQQLVGGGTEVNAITNSVFALTDIPLDVGWEQFGTERATQLLLQMGNYIVGSLLHFNFVWWGNSRKLQSAA